MGRTPALLEHENMDDNTTPDDMNEHDPHTEPQDEILDPTEDLGAPSADLDATDELPVADTDESTLDEVSIDATETVAASDETDETDDGADDVQGDDLLAAAAALDDPEDTVDGDELGERPEPESVWAQDEILGDSTAEEPVGATMPPPYAPVGEADRLVRDPNATLGGVASGIAHRYGFEVALTRLAFVLVLLFSGGTALLGYLLAWIVIPRATYWPPAPRQRSGRFSTRELGIGLVGLGALVGLAIGGGAAGSVLVPLALVGGGVWLLMQEPRLVPAAVPMAAASVGGGVMTPPPPPAYTTAPGASVPPASGAPVPPPAPVPPRSRGRRVVKIGLIGGFLLALLAIIAIPIIIIVAIANSDFEVTTDRQVVSTPFTVDEIPSLINEEDAEIILDLRQLDIADFEGQDTPLDVRIDLDFGVVDVIVPDGIRVDVDAEALAGDVDVFDSSSDGLFNERIVRVDDPHLDLVIDVKAGEVDVRRG
jgi:phage shock protein PspC (stress-responsive transcriptional regulator)